MLPYIGEHTMRNAGVSAVRRLDDFWHRDVDLHCEKAKYPDIPLTLAAERGQMAVTKLLLRHRATSVNQGLLNAPYWAFEKAASGEHDQVMKVLLDNPENRTGQIVLCAGNALYQAVRVGNEAMLALFLDRDDVDPNWLTEPNRRGR